MWARAAVALAALTLAAPVLAHPPRGIVVARDGTVYFSDLVNVRAIGPDGTMRLLRTADGGHIHALALSADGALWGEESAYDPANGSYREGIWRRAPSGRMIWRYGPTKALERGVGLLRDRQGCTWHLDEAVQGGPPLVHRKCGARPASRLFGSAADDQRFRPVLVGDLSGTALDAKGRLVFRHGGLLRRLASDGTAEVLAEGVPPGNFGLALGPEGTVYLADWGGRRIVAVKDGEVRTRARSEPGWAPSGVAWRDGSLYVLEASLHLPKRRDRLRVRRIGRTGDTILATVTAGGG